MKDATIPNKTAYLNKLKTNRLTPVITNCWRYPSSEIYNCIHFTPARETARWTNKRELPKKRKGADKDPDAEEALSQQISIATGRGVCVNGRVLKNKRWSVVSMTTKVRNNTQERIQRQGQCLCRKSWTTGIHKEAALASEILNGYLWWQLNTYHLAVNLLRLPDNRRLRWFLPTDLPDRL
jgi:hypothetical protein